MLRLLLNFHLDVVKFERLPCGVFNSGLHASCEAIDTLIEKFFSDFKGCILSAGVLRLSFFRRRRHETINCLCQSRESAFIHLLVICGTTFCGRLIAVFVSTQDTSNGQKSALCQSLVRGKLTVLSYRLGQVCKHVAQLLGVFCLSYILASDDLSQDRK